MKKFLEKVLKKVNSIPRALENSLFFLIDHLVEFFRFFSYLFCLFRKIFYPEKLFSLNFKTKSIFKKTSFKPGFFLAWGFDFCVDSIYYLTDFLSLILFSIKSIFKNGALSFLNAYKNSKAYFSSLKLSEFNFLKIKKNFQLPRFELKIFNLKKLKPLSFKFPKISFPSFKLKLFSFSSFNFKKPNFSFIKFSLKVSRLSFSWFKDLLFYKRKISKSIFDLWIFTLRLFAGALINFLFFADDLVIYFSLRFSRLKKSTLKALRRFYLTIKVLAEKSFNFCFFALKRTFSFIFNFFIKKVIFIKKMGTFFVFKFKGVVSSLNPKNFKAPSFKLKFPLLKKINNSFFSFAEFVFKKYFVLPRLKIKIINFSKIRSWYKRLKNNLKEAFIWFFKLIFVRPIQVGVSFFKFLFLVLLRPFKILFSALFKLKLFFYNRLLSFKKFLKRIKKANARALFLGFKKKLNYLVFSLDKKSFYRPVLVLGFFYVFSIIFIKQKIIYFDDAFSFSPLSSFETRSASKVSPQILINSLKRETDGYFASSVISFKFQVGSESQDVIENFSIANSKIIKKDLLESKSEEETVTLSYLVNFKSFYSQETLNFPFDQSRIGLILENKNVFPEEMVFITDKDSIKLSSSLKKNGYFVEDKSSCSGVVKAEKALGVQGFSYPAAGFFLRNTASSFLKSLVFVLPIIFLFFFSIFVFISDFRFKFKNLYLLLSLAFLLSFRFFIHPFTPELKIFSTLDSIFVLSFSLSLALFAFLNLNFKRPGSSSFKWISNFLFISLFSIFLIIFTKILF